MSVHPTDPDVVFIGGTNIYRSTDAFFYNSRITWIGGYDPEEDGARIYPNHHPDQHGVIFSPSQPDRMISFNDGGVFVTEDSRAENVSYSSLNNGYVTTQFYTGALANTPPDDFVFGGTQDNGTLLTTNTAINTPDNGTRCTWWRWWALSPPHRSEYSITCLSRILEYSDFLSTRTFN